MDNIKTKALSLSAICEKVARALDKAAIIGETRDMVADSFYFRYIGICAEMLREEVPQLTKSGIAHFGLILEKCDDSVVKMGQHLAHARPDESFEIVLLLLRRFPEKLGGRRLDSKLENMLEVYLLHLQVMVARVRLHTGR